MRKTPRQLTVNSRSYAASCGRCAALMLPNASVCRSCGGFAVDHNRRSDYDRPVVFDQAPIATVVQVPLDDALPSYLRPNPERLSTILSCWPFGAAEASDGPAITTFAEPALPARHLELVAHRSDVPTQRAAIESVPAIGPNPFLSAARIEQAHEAVRAL
jgi:hypothetical protein